MFTLQGVTYRYNSSDRNLEVGGKTYLAATISRSEINETTERSKNELTIKFTYLLNPGAPELPSTQPLGDLFRPYAPTGKVQVICMALHAGDNDLEAKVEWMGRVISPKFSDTALMLTCEQVSSRKNFRGVLPRATRGCSKALYGCGVAASDHAFPAVLSLVVGSALTSSAFAGYADGRLEGGYVEWTRSNGLVEQRTIYSHIGNTIVLNYGGAELAAGLTLTAHPGCAHTYGDCRDYFDNAPNYGGFKNLNAENPFDGHRISW
ncbi:phage BR0599 family protein [Xanthomonas sacchari]|uniref:phage BR0599 family protein n=1 Tax=Xanthomonas sacchari TaxID=56458 RepID=UPI0022595261|nr:phage BR0599 family protein [Xanthomonas sacchari]UYK72513.1 phage BR0599 family protein [Xanthomonas sacchari]